MNDKQVKGQLGESYAANFLITQNYAIIQHNFRSRFGEIDLIALDQAQHELVFVEVKARTSHSFGTPQEAFNLRKRNKFLKTIFHFFATSQNIKYSRWRIDLIGLELDKQLGMKRIIHLKNVLN